MALTMLVIGLLVSGWGGLELQRALESRHWPSTTGIVTGATIDEVVHRKREGPETTYHPKIQYQYAVFGQVYRADRIVFGGSPGGSRRAAQKMVDRYPEGLAVTVYYDPNKPSVAVVKAGYRLTAYAMVAVGVVLCAGGVFCWRAWRRKPERRNDTSGK